MLPTDLGTPESRQLMKLYRRLDEPERRSLLDFAAFLVARKGDGQMDAGSLNEGSHPSGSDSLNRMPLEPQHETPPENETVVGAIRRLRRVYPMIDGGQVLHQASALMAAHLVHGRPAPEVILELEGLFATQYASKLTDS